METSDFTATIRVSKTPRAVYNAINNPRAWWSQSIGGITDKKEAIFNYHFQNIHYCKLKLEALVPGKKIVWLVLDNCFHFSKDDNEWKGTKIIFDISSEDEQTIMKFTHEGLVPEYECFEVCQSAWTDYITNSLHGLITKGKGTPNDKDTADFDISLFEKWNSNH